MIPHRNEIMGAKLCDDSTLAYAYPVYHEGKPNPDWVLGESDADYDDMALALTTAHDSGIWLAIIDPDPPNPAKSKIPKHARKIFWEILRHAAIDGLKTTEQDWMFPTIGGYPESQKNRQKALLEHANKYIQHQTKNPFIGTKNPNQAAAVCMSIFGQMMMAEQSAQLRTDAEFVPIVAPG